VLQDITDRKRAEEALRKSEEKFKSIFEGSNDAIMLLNEKGFFDCNPQTYKMFGINSKEEFIKLNPSELSPPNQLDGKNSFESSNEKIRTAYQQGINRFNWIHRRFNGEDFPAEVLLSVFNLGSEQVLQATVRDISERKRAEEEITMLAYSLKSINECVSITDMENKILFVNASFLKTYGYNENELVGKNITIVRLPNTTPDLVKEILPATIHGGWQGELLNKRKDGSKFHIYLSTTMIKDKDDKSLGLIGVATDITELKRAEEELIKAKEKAEQSDKLKSEFLAQMSHEIRTPLNAIVGNVDYLNESFGEKMDSDTRDCFDSIDLASKRIIRTINLILNVAELQVSGYKPLFVKVDLNSEILNKLNQEHQLSAKQKGIEFIYTCKEKDTKVIADEYSITQIFANLIDNAIKYTKKGKVEILLGKNSTGNIMVEIKDTGIGMSKEFLPKLFEPFVQEVRGFSRTYDGNGLGLALVKKYCEINNASIEVESEKNVGSTFRVIVNNKN
jgi:PAS domain S-box-containing protein